jgi:hypothetical protein
VSKIDNGGIGNPIAADVVSHGLLSAPGGATVGPSGLPYRGDGIVVALPEYATMITVLNIDTVNTWVRAVAPHVTGPHNRPRWFGSWQSDGVIYLDVVETFTRDDYDDAVRAGRERNQIAIWDAGRQEEIPTDGDGRVSD